MLLLVLLWSNSFRHMPRKFLPSRYTEGYYNERGFNRSTRSETQNPKKLTFFKITAFKITTWPQGIKTDLWMGKRFWGRVLLWEAHIWYQHSQQQAMGLKNLLSVQMPVRNGFQNNGNLRGVMVTADLARPPHRIAQSFWDMFWQLAGLLWSLWKEWCSCHFR